MTDELIDDPFSAAADPYAVTGIRLARENGKGNEVERSDACQACHCSAAEISLSRRQALIGVGSFGLTALGAGAITFVPMALVPVVAQSAPFMSPCVQTSQKPQPCRHKFCRHYAGDGDYYGR